MEQTHDQEWKTEIRCRIAEIQSGKVKGISGKEVSANIRNRLSRALEKDHARDSIQSRD